MSTDEVPTEIERPPKEEKPTLVLTSPDPTDEQIDDFVKLLREGETG